MTETAGIPATLRAATGHHRAGRLAEAEALYRRILDADPDHAEALNMLGVLARQSGAPDRAVDLIGRALARAPGRPAYLSNLANAYAALGQTDHAIACYRQALAADPAFAAGHLNLGTALADSGDLDGAVACFRRALALRPRLVAAHRNLGTVLRQLGRSDHAVAHLRRAVALAPDNADTHASLGAALADLGWWQDAAACCRRALDMAPGHAEALNILGTVRAAEGAADAAAACYRRAITGAPRCAAYRYNLGAALLDLGATAESIGALHRAVDLDPEHADAMALLAHQLQRACAWPELGSAAAAVRAQTRAALAAGRRPGEMPLLNLYLRDDPAENRAVAAAWSRDIAARVAPWRGRLPATPPRTPGSRLTVGYLSYDFRDHAMGHLIGKLLETHDRGRFRVLAYSAGPDDGSAYRRRIEGACEAFVDIAGLPPLDAARRIRLDGVDILVDLMGHTKGNRLDIVALRPAPVQVHYLGFPGTTGSDFIDYLITDRVLTNPEDAPHFGETLVTLPSASLVLDRDQAAGPRMPARAEAGLPEDGIVFCSFNRAQKIEPEVFGAWMDILRAVTDSVLWLYASDPEAPDTLRREAAARGVDPGRLVFAGRVPKEQHLARLRLVDLGLDTGPCNGHVTTADTLWAGVPVVAVRGGRLISRLSASVLTAAGVPELIAADPDGYRALAIGLAHSPDERRRLRERLAAARTTAPLFDTAGIVACLEEAYRAMWDRFESGATPRPFAVD